MPNEIDECIAEYFNKEENLHRLREKLFNLKGYRLQSDIDNEIAKLYEEHQREIRQTTEQYKEELRQKDNELADFKNSVEIELRESEKNKIELDRLKSDYSEIDLVFKKFSSLSKKHREAIAGIFGGCDSPFDFICGSVQKGHLEQLWDYVSDELVSNDLDEQEEDFLSALFDFSFDAVNRSQREPLFVRLIVPRGATFDGDTMGRTADSSQLGRVKQMLFAGFAHEVTGNVVRRSIVRLE